MKKVLLSILTFMLLISLSSCASPTGDINDKQVADDKNKITNNNDKNDDNKVIDNKDISIDQQTIFEGNDIKVTVTGFDNNNLFGPSINVLIENNSANNIMVQTRKTSVNDVMVDTMFSSSVAAGKKANDSITLSSSDLEIANITTIKNIELSLHIVDDESWDTIIDTDTITLHTSADASFEQEYDDSGFIAFDDNGIKIIIKKLNSSDSFWGSDLHLYIENDTSQDITVQARDVSVNGFMVDPIFSCDILANKKAFDTITFMESDLTDNNITDITDLELKFHIFDSDSWDTIKDTDIINVSFD